MKWNFHYPTFLKHVKRKTSSLTPKDIGAVIAFLGITKEKTVGEIGTGNGLLTIFLSKIAKHIYSYEKKEEHYKIAMDNVKKIKANNITLKNEDGKNFEEIVDVMFIDIPQPWELIHVLDKVKERAMFYLPNLTQVKTLCQKLEEKGYKPYVFTIRLEEWDVEEKKAKPKHIQLYHTGWFILIEKDLK